MFAASVISIDSRILAQHLLSEPVFLIPFLCIISGNDISQFILIILIFQIFSIFSVQLGKFSPPEYQAGAVSAFMFNALSGIYLINAIALGILMAYVFNWINNFKYNINAKIVNTFKNSYLCIVISCISSIIIYMSVYCAAYYCGTFIMHYVSNMNASIILFISLPILYLKQQNVNRMQLLLFLCSLIFVSILIWLI